jgi:DNA-binding NarL/FixJ family response regulator
MKRVLILADHTLVAHAIRMALRQTGGFEIVGFVDGRKSANGPLVELHPDVILVADMRDPADSLARLREARQCAPQAQSLLLTPDMAKDRVAEAFEAGADAVLSKALHPAAFGTLLREIVRGSVIHRPRARAAAGSPTDCPLTSRELEILRLAAQGMTNGRIARELWVTEQTVKFHLSNTYRKLGVSNRTEASRYALAADLLPQYEPIAA